MKRNLISAMIVVSVAGWCFTATTASGEFIYNTVGTADTYTVGDVGGVAVYWDISYIPSTTSTPSYNTDLAVAFIPDDDYFLTTIEIGLGWYSGTDGVDVWLMKDDGGEPGETIKSFLASGLPTYGSPPSYKPGTMPLVQITSSDQPKLEAGITYWVVASGDEESQGACAYWLSTSTSSLYTLADIDLVTSSSWTVFNEVNGLPPALRVSGNIVPLPGAVWLLGTGLMASAGLLRRLRP